MYKIAILYIAIGKYEKLWNDFYKSCELNFLCDARKSYYVFTDSKRIYSEQHVHVIPAKDYGWPRNVLDRYHLFDKVSNDLLNYDFCFFFNANVKFLKKVDFDEFIPDREHDYLVNLSWETDNWENPSEFPYERNQNSTACIKSNEGLKYYRSGIMGGRTKEFLEMKDVLKSNITEDDRHHIIAIHHDESHLNKYLLNKKPLCLSIYYGRPEEWIYPEYPAIIFRKKEDILGILYIFKLKKKPTIFLLRGLYSRIKKCLHFKC